MLEAGDLRSSARVINLMIEPAPNQTATKFGYPDTLIAEYRHWLVLARPQQPVLGAVVLLCRDKAQSFSKISTAAFSELSKVTDDLENALQAAFQPDKLNYLMLMMVDPDVHFHVMPRYQSARHLVGRDFNDAYWPKPIDLTQPVVTDTALTEAVRDRLKGLWRQLDS